jgi:hypothetical protein
MHRDEFDSISLMVRSGLSLSFVAMASKASLGVATLGMVTSLYLKIKIIYKQDGASDYKKYSIPIFLLMGLVILANTGYVIFSSI